MNPEPMNIGFAAQAAIVDVSLRKAGVHGFPLSRE